MTEITANNVARMEEALDEIMQAHPEVREPDLIKLYRRVYAIEAWMAVIGETIPSDMLSSKMADELEALVDNMQKPERKN